MLRPRHGKDATCSVSVASRRVKTVAGNGSHMLVRVPSHGRPNCSGDSRTSIGIASIVDTSSSHCIAFVDNNECRFRRKTAPSLPQIDETNPAGENELQTEIDADFQPPAQTGTRPRKPLRKSHDSSLEKDFLQLFEKKPIQEDENHDDKQKGQHERQQFKSHEHITQQQPRNNSVNYKPQQLQQTCSHWPINSLLSATSPLSLETSIGSDCPEPLVFGGEYSQLPATQVPLACKGKRPSSEAANVCRSDAATQVSLACKGKRPSSEAANVCRSDAATQVSLACKGMRPSSEAAIVCRSDAATQVSLVCKALNIEALRAEEGEARLVWSSVGAKGRGETREPTDRHDYRM
ncbi:hypothetical protein PR048_030710 [Dryococelus australis]|uniref:Uncharacterized protein n=1 Tax=Dryococelus australis TaxID=614101 RepID=A0ABQ9GCD3_9NEOP|nr:hypothetical protein PR048_030710 [Dryococelus australis]